MSTFGGISLPELLAVEFLEWILFGADRVFVFKVRQDALPPVVVGGSQFLYDVRMIGNDIVLFARVTLQIVQLLIVHQRVLPVANRAACILRIRGLPLWPAPKVRDKNPVGPLGFLDS